MASKETAMVGVIMGSKSDFESMSAACEVMTELKIAHEVRVLSAHRTPDQTARVRRHRAPAGPEGHNRRRRRRGASAGRGRGENVVAGYRRADGDYGHERNRLAPVDRADAQGSAGCDHGDWKIGRGKRGPVRRADYRAGRSPTRRAAREVARRPRPGSFAAEAAVKKHEIGPAGVHLVLIARGQSKHRHGGPRYGRTKD